MTSINNKNALLLRNILIDQIVNFKVLLDEQISEYEDELNGNVEGTNFSDIVDADVIKARMIAKLTEGMSDE